MRVVLMGVVSLVIMGCSGNEAESQNPELGAQPASEVATTPQPNMAVVGEKIYSEYCFSCHTPGLNGAPKLGDAEAWAPRVAKGEELLLQTTIEGIPPAMPPRGICMSCSDEELAAAIQYMIAGQ